MIYRCISAHDSITTITDYSALERAVENCGWVPTVILDGMAKGVDTLGERYALEHQIPVEYYPANWRHQGKAAGYLRNTKMAEHAEALILIWDGVSKGSQHMLNIARRHQLRIHVHLITLAS